jgi:hypothetical protein
MTTPILSITELADGQVDQFATANEMVRALEGATQNYLSVDLSAGNATLSLANYQDYFVFVSSGNTVSRSITVQQNKRFFAVRNGGSAALSVILGSTTKTLPAGETAIYYTDGAANGLYTFAASASSTAAISVEITASATLALTHAGQWIDANHGSTAITITVPPNSSVAFPVDTEIHIRQKGAAAVDVAAGSGVTINKPASQTLGLAEQYAVVTLKKLATDTWALFGMLA